MIGLMKKMQSDDLLQLALLLSLLRVDRNIYSHVDVEVPAATLPARVGIMDEWDAPTYFRHFRHGELHPKSLDSMLLDYEQRVFDDLNSLGRYNLPRHRNVTAYLLNVGTAPDVLAEPGTAPDVLAQPELEPRAEESPLPPMPESPDSSLLNGSLDSLFQDGPLSPPIPDIESEVDFAECDESFKSESFCDEKDELCWSKAGSTASVDSGYNWLLDSEFGENSDYELVSKKERLKAVESEEREEEEKARKEVKKEDLTDEVEIKEELEEEQEGESEAEAYPLLAGAPDAEEPLAFSNEFALEETLQLVSLDDVSPSANPVAQESFKKDVSDEAKGKACSVTRKEKDFFEECHEELELFFDMIQTPQFHHNPRPFSGRMSYMRPMNMEQQQRWQDLANFLSLPESPYQHHAAAAAAAYHPAHPGHHPAHPPHGGHPGHPHGHPTNGSYHHHHHHHHNMTSALPQPDRSVLLHNATLAPPVGDLNSSCPYPTIGANSNFGSAVATSMNLTNSSEPIGNENSGASFKMEPSSHDMMYYQNSSSEINQTDGFLSSILNDEDLQLMDMAMNEEMYSMRMLEGAVGGNNSMMGCHTTGERAGTDSDSAVSSMGSERVPSLSSDNEWMETNSDSGHNIADHYNSDYRKYRCYDYQYSTRSHTASENSTSSRLPVAPQKKYHMYGKRYLQEQASGAGPDLSAATPEEAAIAPLKYEPSTSTAMPVPNMLPAHDMKAQQESKYSCSIEFACNNLLNSRIGDHVNHNHTYHLPPENIGTMQRPYLKDKQKCRRNDEHQQQMTRDEKRARALNIPISVMDIINLPMDEFNERLSKYDLSESQLSLIRDIRRRGKNKVAAQNCRKRKLDQIICLADEVQQMRDRKNRAEKERHYLITERHRIKELFNQLYRHIFQNLRDPDGNPYSSYEYSLQMAADGSIVLMPRDNGTISPLVDPSEYSHLRGRHKDPPHKQ